MSKILIAGFACWSVIAAGQSSGNSGQAADTAKEVKAREVATGHASGKVAPMNNGVEGGTSGQTARTGNMKLTSAQPTITDNKKTTQSGDGQARVAVGDLNGDGKADVAASKPASNGSAPSTAINNSHSNIKNRDLATGQASGKRTVTKDRSAVPQK